VSFATDSSFPDIIESIVIKTYCIDSKEKSETMIKDLKITIHSSMRITLKDRAESRWHRIHADDGIARRWKWADVSTCLMDKSMAADE
jgi:hypothetical protein